MTSNNMPRVMWLLNHTSARKFEIPMLKKIGFTEIFLPKKYPHDPSFRSASVDFSEDQFLTIPKEDLQILNETNWYECGEKEAWEIANKYFDVVFFILPSPEIAIQMTKYFKGIVLWRVYGTVHPATYSYVLDSSKDFQKSSIAFQKIHHRFWFAQAYEHLHIIEDKWFKKRNVFLPLGLHNASLTGETWDGRQKKVFFVCPDIAFNNYYKKIHEDFKDSFGDLPHIIGGAQPINVSDPHVLGFVSSDMHKRNMREMRVMFYHSTEPNHIHYHPFEAIRAGMPLVFMAGGMLDKLGGEKLPGRCKTIKEARKKIERILKDDWKLIEHIQISQVCLLEPMKPANCEEAWKNGFHHILENLAQIKNLEKKTVVKKTRIAVIVPVGYRGGSLRGAKLLAQAIYLGSVQAGQDVEVVFAHLDDPICYPEEAFTDLPKNIKRRPYKWRSLGQVEAIRAMHYAELDCPLEAPVYQTPDDGIQQFMDCDLWIFISDRLEYPLLPLRPYVVMVYDYLQRYKPLLPSHFNQQFISTARSAECVLVTTEFTRQDALQFAGLPSRKVIKVPMLAPIFKELDFVMPDKHDKPYFLWVTNSSMHKNHANAFKALVLYYEKYEGKLACRVTGADTKNLIKSELPHLKMLKGMRDSSSALKQNLKFSGELSELSYQSVLKNAQFLWHAGEIDNGTFSVIEAACMGVPSLSSDYPAMREINQQFNLNLNWMNAQDLDDMACRLKQMEINAMSLRDFLPSQQQLMTQSVEHLADDYWGVVQQCL